VVPSACRYVARVTTFRLVDDRARDQHPVLSAYPVVVVARLAGGAWTAVTGGWTASRVAWATVLIRLPRPLSPRAGASRRW
jgi:hypothetical protein